MSSEYGVGPAQQQPRRGNLFLGLVMGVALGLALLGGTWVLLGGTSGSRTPAPTASRTPSASATPSRTPSRSATPTPSPTPSGTPTPSVTPTADGGGAVTSLPSGTLYTVLESLPKSTTTLEAALARAAEFAAGKPRPVVVVDSDAFATFRPGYWAVGVAGATTRDESVAISNEFGEPRGDRCYSREVP